MENYKDLSCCTTKWTTGYVCATSLYSLWADEQNLNALIYLLCNENGEYTAKFTTVSITNKQLLCRTFMKPEQLTSRKVELASLQASVPGSWPLFALDSNIPWRSIYGNIICALKQNLNFFELFKPVVFGTNLKTGLLIDIQPAEDQEENLNFFNINPSPAIMNVFSNIDLDSTAIRAQSMKLNGNSLSRARLCVLQNSCFSSNTNISLEVELITKKCTFMRKYESIYQPAVKKVGNLEDIFNIVNYTLTLFKDKVVTVKVLIPKCFDFFIVDSQKFYITSLMVLYKQWNSLLFSDKNFLTPIFVYLGPELNPKGEEFDYCHMIGFPGFPVLKARSPDTEAIREVIDTYISTDGLWPSMGISTFHILAPWDLSSTSFLTPLTTKLLEIESHVIKDNLEIWPSGRITSILNHPIAIQGLWIAKFDFSAFFPTLFLAIFPNHNRLANIIKARICREKPGLKPALVSFFGGLQHIHPLLYRVVIGLANGISQRIEKRLNELQFAICTYVKDGFWGVFGNMSTDSTQLEDIEIQAEKIRVCCCTTANEYLTELGLKLPNDIKLHMRLEGIYTDAISWATNSYWLWNRKTDVEDFIGFPSRSVIGKSIKSRLSSLLRNLATMNSKEDLQALLKTAKSMCDEVIEMAYIKKGDLEFWTIQFDIEKFNDLPSAIYNSGTILDRDFGPRSIVYTRNYNNELISIPWMLFPKPIVIKNIDCITHLEPLFKNFSSMLNRAIESFYDSEDCKTSFFTYSLSDYEFLFT
ncbi:helicase-primase subunit [Canid alphaherpesvirus 1]|uniref:Helicase-primase subunit n=2 Tax=Canid alphaherpesvirus 1 TaxID=170325 RepID=A0A172DSN0_9ALPH|nr:helicase-primase subunit [Canid alphaherpesvirus 1]ALL26008.1 helicase-primase subunit [Canid alphaherpesvirus 1]ALL26083.1 helicase-primase subunit [Canid alphaherpesvirus 1]ARE29855.1 helicase-primase subunit [Canid alphaherpesvirus 1]QQL08502.1 helicase-primase subunit [Canid alphaherpesvirus 1]QQL08577.1 helicase-primase subunit [Canid alphaherpesvirus 1]